MDLFNGFSYLNIPVASINIEVFEIVTNSTVALLIFLISYNEIDNRKIVRDDNSKNLAIVLLLSTYQECVSTLELLNDRKLVEEYIVPKVDFNKCDKDNKIIVNLQTLPFENHFRLLSLAEKGYLLNNEIDTYLKIKKEFSYVVSMKITFFDLSDATTLSQEKLKNEMDIRYYNLISSIKIEIERLTKTK